MTKDYDFTYKQDGINFRAVFLVKQYKVYAKLGNRTGIGYGKTVEEAQEKATNRLKAPLH